MAIEESFDRVADGYASFRPQYPGALFDLVSSHCANRGLAWEVGCGSGQATAELAARFDRVEACDPAPSAIAHAPSIPGVHFSVGRAESSSLADGQADLVASAQAAHWFDMPAFAEEARRVAAPEAIVALWTYDRPRIDPELDTIQDHLYFEVLEGCWDPRRAYVDSLYTTLPFPFEEIEVSAPNITMEWTRDHLLGYLRTWSAVQEYANRHGEDAVECIEPELCKAWNDPDQPRLVQCLVGLRLGRIHG